MYRKGFQYLWKITYFTKIGNFKPARWAATERAFIFDGVSFGSCSPLSPSGFNRFSIIKEADFSLILFSLPDAAAGLEGVA